MGVYVKKPRGKQATKPDLKKALLQRNMELKGSDKSTLTIPIIYRRTFDWTSPEVNFIPINHRSFVVFRGDLEAEEYQRDLYRKIILEVESLPNYSKKRVTNEDEAVGIELKEAILAASIKDRYVQLTIPKPGDPELYDCLKSDMEAMVSELGFEYSTDNEGIQCVFKFPKHDLRYYCMESKNCVQNAVNSLRQFQDLLEEKKIRSKIKECHEMLYNINRQELLMDKYYTDGLSLLWDLPNIACPGQFLWINACELILDEFQFIAKETENAITVLEPVDIKYIGMEKDIFSYIWSKALETSLKFCEEAISTINIDPDDECIDNALSLIYNFELHWKSAGTIQSKFIKLFTGEEKYFKDKKRAQKLLAASYHLNNIFQSSERVIVFSTYIAKNTLGIGMFNRMDNS